MGRKSLPMKPIEDKVNRQVTFSKRRSGLFKKAQDLSTLCQAVVGLILFSESGRMYEFSSGQSLPRIVERYKSHTKEKGKEPLGCCEAEEQRAGSDKANLDLLAIVESLLQQQRSVPQILQLEEQLQAALLHTQSTKTELLTKSWLDFQQQQVVKMKEENSAVKEESTVLKEENTALKEENTALKQEAAAANNSRNEAGTSSFPEQPHLLQLL